MSCGMHRKFECANPRCSNEVEVKGEAVLPGEVWPSPDDKWIDGLMFPPGPHLCSMKCARELADILGGLRKQLSPDQRR